MNGYDIQMYKRFDHLVESFPFLSYVIRGERIEILNDYDGSSLGVFDTVENALYFVHGFIEGERFGKIHQLFQ
jgi:hypothetical protein